MMRTLIEPLEARIAPATFIVSNNLDAGPGSLRQAILNANSSDGLDIIILTVLNSLPIKPITPLPAITDSVNIHSGFGGDHRTLLDGTSTSGDSGSGLTLLGPDSSGSTISGLAIVGFSKAGIAIEDSSENLVEGNYIGIKTIGVTGDFPMPDGILVNGGAVNRISYNVVGSNKVGIRVTGNAIETSISGNTIGSVMMPNDVGILVESASRTAIENRNTITSNVHAGIKLVSGAVETEVYNNLIGVEAQNYRPLGPQEWGIYIDGASGTIIGSGNSASSFDRGNVISKNFGGGIWIKLPDDSTATRIEGNIVGDRFGTDGPDAGNGGPGIFVTSAQTLQLYPRLSISGNLISGNKGAGIQIHHSRGFGTIEVTSNVIGLDSSGTKPLGNGAGIIVDGVRGITIGGSYPFGNTIAANKGDGILVKSGDSVGIFGNNIGYVPGTDGAAEFGNAGHGVYLAGVGSAFVGYSVGKAIGNIITWNGGDGIRLDGSTSPGGRYDPSYIQIGGNFIGTDGFTTKGNQGAGIHILDLMPEGTVSIGDSGPTPNLNRTSGWNVVSGNDGDGILVERSDKVSIGGNYVGTDFQGLHPIGNGGDGIALIDTYWATISGGKSPSIVAANLGHGISIVATSADSFGNPTSKGNTIRYTNVGLGADGNTRMENGLSAIVVDKAASSSIGGGGTPSGNRIYSQNVALQLDGANQTRVFDNEFRSISGPAVVFDHGTWGTEFGGYLNDGSKAGNMVISEANSALLISEGASNSVTNNQFEAPIAGISIVSGSYNSIIGNQFKVGVDGLFIDLGGDGVTPNDPLDVDSGPNDLLNSPSLISAALRDGRTLIRGEYRGAADAEITVSWYANGSRVGTSVVRTDATGMAKLELNLEEEFAVGTEFGASGTTYAAEGSNTSEFSNAVFAMEAPEVIAKGAVAGQKARAQLVDAVTGEVILEEVPFGKGYRGGVSVAAADVDGDGFTDLIATQRKGDGIVKIYSGLDGHLINSFWLGAAKGSAIRSLVVGDLDGDGTMEIVTGLANTKGGRVLVHDALTGVFEADFAPFGVKIPSRLSVGLSDADGDGHPEIIVLSGSKRVVLDPISGQIEQLARITKGRAAA